MRILLDIQSVTFLSLVAVLLSLFLHTPTVSAQAKANGVSERLDRLIGKTLEYAGSNRPELEKAINSVSDQNKPGMRFLLAYMPENDAQKLTSDFLTEHVNGAYVAWRNSPWKDQVSEETFLNYILPYCSVSEKRESWRTDFMNQFSPLVREAKTASEAAVILNQKIFQMLEVKYSTKRRRADQGPYESIEIGKASCTGLSIILIDACRAVGVPARFVGIPKWTDGSGNHSWVEIWDQEWKYTGAAEPTGHQLNRGWFSNRASLAQIDDPRHSIYAVSLKKTNLRFPMVWARNSPTVWSTNVTARYTLKKFQLQPSEVLWRIKAVNPLGERVATKVVIIDEDEQTIFDGETKNESFDANDHLNVVLKKNSTYQITYGSKSKPAHSTTFKTTDKSPTEPLTLKCDLSK